MGTSGWQYASWRERFYPKGVPQRRWLPYYAERFATVEVNNTFYNLPATDTFRHWGEETPPDFRFVLKASRYLTHIRRLRDPDEPVKLFLERSRPLRRRTGAILVQLPPRFKVDIDRLRDTLRAFPRTLRVAVEFRDESWYIDSVRDVLAHHHAALCHADRLGESSEPEWNDAGWMYVRFHEGDGSPYPCYRRRTLAASAQQLATMRGTSDIYVFFNNDPLGCAVRDAAMFADLCGAAGADVSRAPALRSVRAGA
ncbi:MAG: DUF72 domain-containing protein [Candidatus Dormibacteria bacterium]